MIRRITFASINPSQSVQNSMAVLVINADRNSRVLYFVAIARPIS